MGLEGFKVVSSLNVENLACQGLKSEIYQLALLLYPPELLNEKFLIKIRDCVLKLDEKHPLKKWLRSISQSRNVDESIKNDFSFLVDIVNSPFNLITDVKLRKRISGFLIGMPEESLPEIFLKSYLYLMIGNITRSDNLLKKILSTPPRMNWREKSGKSLGHRIGKEFIEQIFQKLGRHPADRKVFKLVILYIQSYFNEQSLLELADEVDTKDLEAKLSLKAIEVLAPELVQFLHVSSMGQEKRMAGKEADVIGLSEQAYWVWPFLEIGSVSSSNILKVLQDIEIKDELWYVYLISEEKISDTLAKQSINNFLPGQRSRLKTLLDHPGDFMLALYKLIELGDVSGEMVEKTIKQLVHE